jgi:ATP-dependent Clp protease adaptor protein ClpS
MWKIVIHNDDFTPVDFVIQILMQLFDKPANEAIAMTMYIHEKGKVTVGLFTKQVAQTKVIHVLRIAEQNGHPLLATAEEA